VKRRSVEEVTPLPQIYQQEVAGAVANGTLTQEASFHLPQFASCKTSAYRHRRQRFPVLPRTREDIILEGEWTQTQDGDNWLIANDGDAEKLLIFGSTEGLLKTARARTLFMDGTFYITPYLFAQLYTVHANVFGQSRSFPLIYGLLPDKRQQTYERFLTLIQGAVENVQGQHLVFEPREIVTDFEMGAIQAIHNILPGTATKGCLFHYGQAINRCVQRIGLAAEYRAVQNEQLRQWIRRICALPMIPLEELDGVWAQITLGAPNIPAAAEMHNYVNTTWMDVGARFSRNIWNHFDRLDQSRTNNAMEGWHSKINKYVGKAHPNIFELLSFLKQEESFQRGELLRLENGGQPKPKCRKYVRNDANIVRLKEQLINGGRDVMQYLDAMSYLLQS
jgi:hypothetical protein